MSKPSDLIKVKKGSETLEVTRKAYDVVYSLRGYKEVSTAAKKTADEDTNKEG